jgi:hypothetical protein
LNRPRGALPPHGAGGVYDDVVVRYGASGDFGSPASGATFDASSLDVDGGRARGFAGAGTDGRDDLVLDDRA